MAAARYGTLRVTSTWSADPSVVTVAVRPSDTQAGLATAMRLVRDDTAPWLAGTAMAASCRVDPALLTVSAPLSTLALAL
jgi:hypothetical protein